MFFDYWEIWRDEKNFKKENKKRKKNNNIYIKKYLLNNSFLYKK